MGIMVYSLYWVMQDFVHQQYGLSPETESLNGFRVLRFRVWAKIPNPSLEQLTRGARVSNNANPNAVLGETF